jgi:hypothetical protein
MMSILKAQAAERYALLVSIGTYRDPEISNLPRSEDADLMEKVLIERWHFKPANLFKLTESQATKRAILEKLQLIAQRAGPEDAVLFFFSGHGGTTAQHFSLCPWDAKARSADNDLTEADLAEWVRSLKTANVTIILDCCFDKIGVKSPQIRPKAIGFSRDRGKPASHTFGIPAENAIVLKACQEDEQAQQEISPEGDTSYGVFTYNLVKALYDVPEETTYRQLIERLRTEVTQYIHKMWPSEPFLQTPRIAGSEQQQNRRLFQRNGKSLPPYRLIQQVEGELAVLDAGETAGVRTGSRYAVYPPNTETFEAEPPVGLIEVVKTEPNAATARIVEGKERIVPNCRARLVEYPERTTTARCRMHLNAPEHLQETLRTSIQSLEYIELTDTPLQRDWVLEVKFDSNAKLHAVLYESDGKTPVHRVEVAPDGDVRMLPVEASGSSVQEVIRQLQPVWLNFYAARVLLDLKNPNPSFKIELRTDKERYQEGDPFIIRFKSEKDCYLILVAIDPTGTPTVLYPWQSSQPRKVEGGKEYVLTGPSTDMQWVIKPPTGRECLVAIATLQEVPPHRLEQLLQLLGQLQAIKQTPQEPPVISGIKTVVPVQQIQNLPLNQWNIAVCHFLSEEKAGKAEDGEK